MSNAETIPLINDEFVDSSLYSINLIQGKPKVIVWISLYCMCQAVTSFVPAMVILLFPSFIDHMGSFVSIGSGNFYYWAIVQLGESALYSLTGILCWRGSLVGWCSIIADPISTILAMFMLGAQAISDFGPYHSWVVDEPWHSCVILIIYLAGLLLIPYSFIAAIVLLMEDGRLFFKLNRLSRSLVCLTITTLFLTVVTIFEVSSWGDILGVSRMEFFQ